MSSLLYTVKIKTDFNTANLLNELLPSKALYPSSFYCETSFIAEIYLYGETLKEVNELYEKVGKYLKSWQKFAKLNEFSITIETIKKDDWAESWKKFFHPKRVSERVVIKPSWEGYQPAKGEIVVEIDPGLSFGTGVHPTTCACIQFLDKISADHINGRMMDIGCGSGILSIVALKLGFRSVSAFDSDPESVRVANENITLAKLNGEVVLIEQSLEDYKGHADFDVVVANLNAPILIANVRNIVSALKKNHRSRIIISGILNEEYEYVLRSFIDQGMKEIESTVIEEWTTCLLGLSLISAHPEMKLGR